MSSVKHPGGNTLITQDYHVITEHRIHHIPGCICALDGYDGVLAVVHEDGKTKILLVVTNGPIKMLLERDSLIDIINISQYDKISSFRYIFSTPEGVRFVFNGSGKRVKRPRRIPKDTVGIAADYSVNYNGEVRKMKHGSEVLERVNGYRSENGYEFIGWTDHVVLDFNIGDIRPSSIFNYHRQIEDVYREDVAIDIVMILSEGTIHVKGFTVKNDQYGNRIIESYKLIGKWGSAPFYLDGLRYAIDDGGVLRDIRSAWPDKGKFYGRYIDRTEADISLDMLYSTEPSLYEQGITKRRSIGRYHGMRIFSSSKMVKSARKR